MQEQDKRRRQRLERRTIPFLAAYAGMVAVDINGRYTPLQPREHAMGGETLIQCPDARWTVEDLERALGRNYESAIGR